MPDPTQDVPGSGRESAGGIRPDLRPTCESSGVLPETHDGRVDDRQLSSEVGVVDGARVFADVLDDEPQVADGPTQRVDVLLDHVVAHRTVCRPPTHSTRLHNSLLQLCLTMSPESTLLSTIIC